MFISTWVLAGLALLWIINSSAKEAAQREQMEKLAAAVDAELARIEAQLDWGDSGWDDEEEESGHD